MKTIAVSGGFDPIHIGHVRMFEEARKLGDRLVVILNGDSWLMRKKGFVFMPAEERAALILALKPVDEVYIHNSMSNDVVDALAHLRPQVFANGGDRHATNTPEVELCERVGIKMAWGVGGGKANSSSDLVVNACTKLKTTKRPWGSYTIHASGKGWVLKTLDLEPNTRTSLQSHAHRDEVWTLIEGDAWDMGVQLIVGVMHYIKKGEKHRLATEKGCTVIEVILGDYDEKDITRYEDDYGRI